MSILINETASPSFAAVAELDLDLEISPIEDATARLPWGSMRMNQLETRTVFAAA